MTFFLRGIFVSRFRIRNFGFQDKALQTKFPSWVELPEVLEVRGVWFTSARWATLEPSRSGPPACHRKERGRTGSVNISCL